VPDVSHSVDDHVHRPCKRWHLAAESVHWLADRRIGMFGVEAVSPAPEGKPNFQAHLACGERAITHMECPANMDQLVGGGLFRFKDVAVNAEDGKD
jgi:kynurenine formamidase